MPPVLTNPLMLAAIALGLAGAVSVVIAVYLLAVRWRGRNGGAYGLSGAIFYGLLYIATLEHGVINSEVDPELASSALLAVQVVSQALVTAVGVAVFTLLLFAGYLALLGPLEFPPNRTKAYAGCALFCFVFATALNPVAAVRQTDDPARRSIYLEALSSPTPTVLAEAGLEAKRTLDMLRQLGAVTRIDVSDNALVHHVRGQFLDLPNDEVREYMRAALVYHVRFDGGRIKPVELRVVGSGRPIATLDAQGRFRRHRAVPTQLSSLPPGQY